MELNIKLSGVSFYFLYFFKNTRHNYGYAFVFLNRLKEKFISIKLIPNFHELINALRTYQKYLMLLLEGSIF